MLYIPTRTDILNLEVGDMASDCYGNQAEIVEITHRGPDKKGRIFIHYCTDSGTFNGQTSMSMKEDELVRHVGTSAKFNSHQLDLIEAEMLAKGERAREL